MPERKPGRPAPRWAALAKDLRDRIESGEFAPGSRLPSEVALAEEYGVSRDTVRRAEDDLAEHGIIEIRQGLGTFVTTPG